MVPTVEREVRTGLVWSMAMAGGMPSMASAIGSEGSIVSLAAVVPEL